MSRRPVSWRASLRAIPSSSPSWRRRPPCERQTGTTNGEWRTYGGDLGSTRYAPLDQINRRQLQEPGNRVALQDRHPRPPARLQPADDAADGQRRALHDRRIEARRRGDRRRNRRAAVDVPPRRRQARRRVAAAALRTRRGVLDRRPRRRADLFRDHRLSARRARRQDRPPRARASARTASSI